MTATSYPGPLRDQPLAIELHNTLYADGGELHDGLAGRGAAGAFVAALGDRLPAHLPPGAPPPADRLRALRTAVREALEASADGRPHDRAAIAAIDAAARAAPASPAVALDAGGRPVAAVDHHGASRADVVLAAFAASAIELVTGAVRGELRACGAPGCVLLYLADDPRRRWCSNACGNRARQARHYRRVRGGG
jgi:predicted RNA-binding Zn ribbon-like protein